MQSGLALSWVALSIAASLQAPVRLAEVYGQAIDKLNEKHARAPGKTGEDELAAKLPSTARKALDDLLAAKASAELGPSLLRAAEAAVELDLEADFERIRKRAGEVAPDQVAAIGYLVSRERFVLRGVDGVKPRLLAHFALVLDAVLDAYDELYGFAEWSKVPGKKLRVRLHLVREIVEPPHFAPQFPYHSEIDFPIATDDEINSPTGDGKFLFYGLCHELGHVIAMWGDRTHEEDHHAWAHYTGVTIVEHVAGQAKHANLLAELRDVRWRSLSKEREAAQSEKPSLASRETVMALLIALHDAVGPQAIGAAINALDAEDKRLRINRVRYYTFAELERALLAAAKTDAARKQIDALFP